MRMYRKCPKCGRNCGKTQATMQYPEICPACGFSLKNQSWYIDYRVHGIRKREATGPNKHLAEEVSAKRKVQILEGRYFDIKKDSLITVDEIAEDFLKYSKNNKKSYFRDVICVNHLLGFFGGKRLNTISPNLIEQYKCKRLDEGRLKPATVNREIACLKVMFNWAIKNGKATANPMKQVRLLRENNTRTRYLSGEEIVILLDNCTHNIRPIVITALTTGMRRGEILNLKWDDVNIPQKVIIISNSKSGRMREIPICKMLDKTLKECYNLKHSKCEYVFCNEQNEQYRSINSTFQNIVKKAKIPDFTFHDMRHTAASYLVMLGVDLATVRDILGHQTINMTLRYAHLSPVHKREAIDRLGAKLDTFWAEPKASLTEDKSLVSVESVIGRSI